MNEPVTTIDSRFSDSDAVPTPWEETRRLLETAELFWIITVRADGRPHVTPLVAYGSMGLSISARVTPNRKPGIFGGTHM